MKSSKIIISLAVLILLSLTVFYSFSGQKSRSITSFEECQEEGFPVAESYPASCRTPDGRTFTQDIGNELEKRDIIQVTNPRPNTTVKSPLTVSGKARGTWFFEASFPLKLLDENGNVIADGIATAQEEWMTEEFVPFTALLVFTTQLNTGTLVLEKGNPSGLPENADELRIPVRFN